MLKKRQVVYVPTLWIKAAHEAVVGAIWARKEATA